MTVGKSVVDLIGGDSLPYAVCILDISGSYFVKINLAQIVKLCGDGDAFVAVFKSVNIFNPFSCKIFLKTVIDVEAVLYKSAFKGIMIFRACGRGGGQGA